MLSTVKYCSQWLWFWDYQHGTANERGQMLPRQGEMGANTPFTRKCNSEPSRTLEKVTTIVQPKSGTDLNNFLNLVHLWFNVSRHQEQKPDGQIGGYALQPELTAVFGLCQRATKSTADLPTSCPLDTNPQSGLTPKRVSIIWPTTGEKCRHKLTKWGSIKLKIATLVE